MREIRSLLTRTVLAAAVALPVSAALAQTTRPAEGQQPAAPASKPADIPVKAVALFSSGVGYFEHFGSVAGENSAELRFKTQQINDILKSLVLQDLDGGKVSVVTYPSQDPISKTLKSFQVDITNNPSMFDLLNQLRGAKVQVTLSTDKAAGTILGCEKKKRPVEKGEPVEIAVLNLVSGATIRSIPLEDVRNLELEDPQLQEELSKALSALAQARDQDKKPVVISFQGAGDRRVRIGYVVETPVWKTSYRLLLPGAGAAANTTPTLQGWAIVENQTDNDWNNIQLSLVSGRPISFVQDLYRPLYVPRPVVQPELYASLQPQQYDAGVQAGKAIAGAAPRPAPAPSAAPQAMMRERLGRGGAMEMEAAAPEPLDATASVASVASAAKIGELFQYTVGNVTLPRQRSAMIPIITDPVEVEKLSIYNQSVLARHPLTGARVKNTTDKHLLQGPITVFTGSGYSGDARIDNVPPGQERLLSYGIDLEVVVNPDKTSQESRVQTGKIVKGVLHLTRKTVAKHEYAIENKSDQAKTLILEHPRQHGWSLVDTEKPVETTDALYRFKQPVEARKPATFTVQQQIVQGEAIAILPADIGQLDFYQRTGEIPQPVRDALAKAIELKGVMVDTERLIAEKNEQINVISQEQNRIRENMKTVDRQTEYYTRLINKLNQQETQIEKLQGERDELQKQLDQQRKALEDYLNGLNVG